MPELLGVGKDLESSRYPNDAPKLADLDGTHHIIQSAAMHAMRISRLSFLYGQTRSRGNCVLFLSRSSVQLDSSYFSRNAKHHRQSQTTPLLRRHGEACRYVCMYIRVTHVWVHSVATHLDG